MSYVHVQGDRSSKIDYHESYLSTESVILTYIIQAKCGLVCGKYNHIEQAEDQ